MRRRSSRTTPPPPPVAAVKSPAPSGPRRVRTVAVAAFTLTVVAAVAVKVAYPMWAADADFRRAKAELAAYDFPAAEGHLRQVLDRRPDHPEAAFLLAQVYRRTERYSESRRQLAVAKRFGWIPEYIELEELLLALLEGGPSGRAEVTVRLYIDAAHPEDRLLMEALTRAYLDSHFWNEAKAVLDKWTERYPDDWYPRYQRGMVREAILDPEGALADYRFVFERNPEHPTVQRMIAGMLISGRKSLDEAEQLAAEQVRLHPDDAEAGVRLAEAKDALGRSDEALAVVERALAAQPDLARGLILKARLIRSRNPQAAIEALQRAEATQPESPQVALLLGQIAGDLGRGEDAKRWLGRHKMLEAEEKRREDLVGKIRSAPHDPGVRYEIGRSMMAVGRDREAVGWFLGALREDTNHVPSHEALAGYYEGKGFNPQLAAQHRYAVQQIKADQK